MKYCMYCGEPLEDDALYCTNCNGRQLDAEEKSENKPKIAPTEVFGGGQVANGNPPTEVIGGEQYRNEIKQNGYVSIENSKNNQYIPGFDRKNEVPGFNSAQNSGSYYRVNNGFNQGGILGNNVAIQKKSNAAKIVIPIVAGVFFVVVVAVVLIFVMPSLSKSKSVSVNSKPKTTVEEKTAEKETTTRETTTAPTTVTTTVPTTVSTEVMPGVTSVPLETEMTVNASHLFIRTLPTTSAPDIGKIPNKTNIRVLARCSNGWYQIEYNGLVGYVSGDYLLIKQ